MAAANQFGRLRLFSRKSSKKMEKRRYALGMVERAVAFGRRHRLRDSQRTFLTDAGRTTVNSGNGKGDDAVR